MDLQDDSQQNPAQFMNPKERPGLRVEGQKMEVLGRLTSTVIHDLNNLLTVIGLNAALIEGGDLSEQETISAAEKISEASRHSAELTRKVLNFARRHREEPEPMDPNEVIESMIRMLSPLMARKVSVRVEAGCDAWILGDRSGIELSVMNLVLNAVDAMPGGGEIVISTRRRGGLVEIEVADEGEGIDPAHGDEIFEPFFTTKETGTGMGLSIVKHVAARNGGRVEYESVLGKGTRFRILLPISEPPQKASASPGESAQPLPSLAGTVLLVEDDNAIRALTRSLLERQFQRVLDATTAEEGLEIWKKEKGAIDLLFTDIVLPGAMSGRDLAVEILRDNPNLPVLYTSGYGSTWEDRSFVNESNFLPKPFPPDVLKQAVNGILARSQR